MHRPTSNLAHGGKPNPRLAGGAASKHPSGIGRQTEAGAPSTDEAGKAASHARVPGGAPLKFKGKQRKKGFSLLEMLVVIGIIVLLASLVLAVSASVIRSSEERATRNTLEVLNAAAEEYERTLDRRVTYQNGGATMGFSVDPAPTAANGLRYDLLSTPTAPPAGCGVVGWVNLAAPYAAPPGGLPAYSPKPFQRTAMYLWAMSQSPTSGALLQKLPDSVFRGVKPSGTSAGFTGLRHAVDSWDTPIIAIFPGRDAAAADLSIPATAANVDKDGTIKCDAEWGTPGTGGIQVSCKNKRVLFISAGNDARFTNLTAGVYAPSTDNLYSYDPQ